MKSTSFAAAPCLVLMLLPAVARAEKAPPPSPETILHIDASAAVPPDQAKVSVTLVGKGATEIEARADLAAKQKSFADQLGQMGFGATSFENGEATPSSPATSMNVEEVAAIAQDAADNALAASVSGKSKPALKPRARPVFVSARTTISVSDLGKMDGLRALGEVNGVQSYQFQRGVRFSASNPDAARKSARESAIAKAKQEAEDFAASLGYKVVRMTRISNSSPPVGMREVYGMFGMIDTMPEQFMPSYFGAMTSVSVSIDFTIVQN